MDDNPFTRMMLNKTGTKVRVVSRRQVLRFYLWSLKQRQNYRTLGCAAMFTYLTGFRAAEVRPFLKDGLQRDVVLVVSAKRKKGESAYVKRRYRSRRLRCVVERALQREGQDPEQIPIRGHTPRRVLFTLRLGIFLAGRHECVDQDAGPIGTRNRPCH